MAKKNKHGNNGRDGGIKINKDTELFVKMSYDSYKKKNRDLYDSKKELVRSYFLYLIDLLPDTIEFCVRYGHINRPEIQNAKNGVYNKLTDPKFVKILTKEIEEGNKIGNIKLLPLLIKEILMDVKQANDAALAQDPNAKVINMTDMVELSQLILKKRLKKMKNAGVPSAIAFDALSVIPTDAVMEFSRPHYISSLYNCLYEHARTEQVPFESVMNVIVDEEFYPSFIVFALLERKERFMKLTDAQKSLYLDISTWCFNIMEKKLDRKPMEQIIRMYIDGRKRDESNGRDSNRRYALASLSSVDYPRIAKVINAMIAEDDSVKKYLM